MRHIPEEEIHAYLDQALSRSQCVEIERHLAECPRCQSLRDGTAALRDRTTALLALIGPPTIVAPPYPVLERRFAEARRLRLRRVATGAWAASIAGAAFLGWTLNQPGSAPRTIPSAPIAVASPVSALPPSVAESTTVRVASAAPVRRPAARLVRVRNGEPSQAPQFGFAQAVETDPATVQYASAVAPASLSSAPIEYADFIAQPVTADPQLAGLWRTVVPDSGTTLLTGDVPLVPGLAVVHMRVQPGHGDGDVTAIDQVLESGEMIRTISGPANRVGPLVSDTAPTDGASTQPASRVTVTIRQGDRMVAVTGPSEALGSLLSRVNSKRRY